MNAALNVATLFMGLFGSPHCALMCGGVAGALGACPGQTRGAAASGLGFHAGRLASYAAVGAAAGWAGEGVASLGRVGPALLALRVLAGAALIVAGLTMAGAGAIFAPASAPLARAWQRLGGLVLRSGAGPGRALGLGLVWGLMPCGFLYAALGLALASANPAQGAALMASFGLGTLPSLLVLGLASRWLVARVRAPGARQAAGLLLACLGLLQAGTVLAPADLLPGALAPLCCQTRSELAGAGELRPGPPAPSRRAAPRGRARATVSGRPTESSRQQVRPLRDARRPQRGPARGPGEPHAAAAAARNGAGAAPGGPGQAWHPS